VIVQLIYRINHPVRYRRHYSVPRTAWPNIDNYGYIHIRRTFNVHGRTSQGTSRPGGETEKSRKKWDTRAQHSTAQSIRGTTHLLMVTVVHDIGLQCESENSTPTPWHVLTCYFTKLKILQRYFKRIFLIQLYSKLQNFVWLFLILTKFCYVNIPNRLDNFYARKQLLLSARLSHRNSARLSVRPSVTRVDQSKTVQAMITKSSPSAAWKTLVSGTAKLFHKFEGVTPNEGAKWVAGGKNLRCLANK